MQFANHIPVLGRVAAGLVVLLLVAGPVEDAQAQWTPKWLNVGDFQNRYQSGGAAPEADEVAWAYPGIKPRATYSRWRGFWVSAKNVQDETGTTWDTRISHVGPRFTGVGEVFDMEQQLISKYEQPTVQVDGNDSFAEPVTVDEVDPSIAPDRIVRQRINTSIGVEMVQRAMQWSHPDHDDYHIIEYTFTNTGNMDDDEEIEVEQSLEDVYFTFLERPTINAFSGAWNNSAGGAAWGQYTMNDAVGDGLSDYGVDFRAQFSWLGNIQDNPGFEINTLGNPMWQSHQWEAVPDDTLGRLGGATFVGVVTLHADTEAHGPEGSSPDDPAQPHTMTYLNNDFGDITSGSNHTDVAKMAKERQWIECGSTPTVGGGVVGYEEPNAPCTPRTWPTHARIVMGQTEDAARDSDPGFENQTADPTRGAGAGGWSYMTSYGPYDMAPGEVVKVVTAEGVAGLSDEAAWEIGRAYKLSGWDNDLVIEFDANGDGTIGEDEAMTKNEWVMTARDSLFGLFQAATDNYNGGAGYTAPHPPAPPTSFIVTSGTDQINLEWTGPTPAGGWEIWRAQKHYSGIVTALSVGGNGIAVPDEARRYELVETLGGSATSYEDTDVERGGEYYYFLQAVGADGTKSSRYYAQTYNPAFLRRTPGQSLSEVRIVPNPYHIGADPGVHVGGDRADNLAFYGIPGQCRIDIYTELGELIDTIEHTNGSGDEIWDLTTSSRQVVASGVYIAVITNLETSENTVQKFIVIR